MKKLKEKLNSNKTLKYSLFFGFYLIFFIVLFIYFNNNNKVEKNNESNNLEEKEIVNGNPMDNILNNKYEIIVNNDGNKDNSSNSFDYNYFLDIHNVNQLIKRSKLVSKDENIYNYEISNLEINTLLNTNKPDGINKINIMTLNSKIKEIELDLHNYFEKDIFIITYKVGEDNE